MVLASPGACSMTNQMDVKVVVLVFDLKLAEPAGSAEYRPSAPTTRQLGSQMVLAHGAYHALPRSCRLPDEVLPWLPSSTESRKGGSLVNDACRKMGGASRWHREFGNNVLEGKLTGGRHLIRTSLQSRSNGGASGNTAVTPFVEQMRRTRLQDFPAKLALKGLMAFEDDDVHATLGSNRPSSSPAAHHRQYRRWSGWSSCLCLLLRRCRTLA